MPIAVLVLAAALPATAQGLLPPAFADWSSTSAAAVEAGALEQLAGRDAEVLREYGALAAERRVYSRGAEALAVTLFRMRDPTSAYGAYTYLLNEQMTPANLTAYSSLSRPRALVTVGNFLVDISGSDVPRQAAALKTLVARLTPPADKAPYPALAHYLPARGLIANSERYLLGPVALQRLLPLASGDWVGFADGAEGLLARYRLNGQEAVLLLAAYPTPQAAARKLEELGRLLWLNPESDPNSGPRPAIFARRAGSLLSLVAYAKSRGSANALLDQIRYETQVTWNEPRYSLTDPSLSQVIVGTILGTGVILLFALAAGIGFGGVRLVVKFFFPGKVFDRADRMEILQLGLSSKPIEAKDFY
ncbi:MAG TPA: DUF6599 family protein [Candidatus Acidoferrales bacterium]|jgi:hypothetical protein|nr:DUF6599 family protein [Candidatus Acidoferrales bacterium]